jgi:hypothetical protein
MYEDKIVAPFINGGKQEFSNVHGKFGTSMHYWKVYRLSLLRGVEEVSGSGGSAPLLNM